MLLIQLFIARFVESGGLMAPLILVASIIWPQRTLRPNDARTRVAFGAICCIGPICTFCAWSPALAGRAEIFFFLDLVLYYFLAPIYLVLRGATATIESGGAGSPNWWKVWTFAYVTIAAFAILYGSLVLHSSAKTSRSTTSHQAYKSGSSPLSVQPR
jgi:hypothetical protein